MQRYLLQFSGISPTSITDATQDKVTRKPFLYNSVSFAVMLRMHKIAWWVLVDSYRETRLHQVSQTGSDTSEDLKAEVKLPDTEEAWARTLTSRDIQILKRCATAQYPWLHEGRRRSYRDVKHMHPPLQGPKVHFAASAEGEASCPPVRVLSGQRSQGSRRSGTCHCAQGITISCNLLEPHVSPISSTISRSGKCLVPCRLTSYMYSM